MISTIVSAALLGFSATAIARPWGPPNNPWGTPTSSYSSASASATASTGEQAFKFPLSNGFPNITNPSTALTTIETAAHGQLSNGAPPATLKNNSIVSLGFVAFNELFEVAFFTELISNITNNVPGYDNVPDREKVLTNLNVIVAQEELHELNANGAFHKFTGQFIEPCEYIFPVDNFMAAIGLASTFTDVVLSTLPDLQTIFANDGDNGLIRGVGSIIGQEGEQNGFYRDILGKVPSALPFLTGGARDFAFNAINQGFVVPGSCPSINLLVPPIKEFGILNVLTTNFTSTSDITADFSFQTQTSVHAQTLAATPSAGQQNFLTYMNQQNVPFSVPIENQKISGDAVTFQASFPGLSHDMNGLTIAAITTTNGPFATPDDVAAVTLFGPGLIEVN